MGTTWGRSVFSVYLILSIQNVHVFCQNVLPVRPAAALSIEANRDCPNSNSPSPQLVNTLLTSAASGVLPDVITSLRPCSPEVQQLPLLQEGCGQASLPLSSTCQRPLLPSGVQLPINPSLILPSPNIPCSIPTGVITPATPVASPPSLSSGLIPQCLSPPTIQCPSSSIQAPQTPACGIMRPFFIPQPASQSATCNQCIAESAVLSELKPASNPTQPINPTCSPTKPSSLVLQQLLRQQQFLNSLTPPVPEVKSPINSYPVVPCGGLYAPAQLQPTLAMNPYNYLNSVEIASTIDAEINAPTTIVQDNVAAVVLPAENKGSIEVTNVVNADITDIQQPAVPQPVSVQPVAEAVIPQSQIPLNLVINVPPVNVPAPAVTVVTVPTSTSAPAIAPSVPQFAYPPMPIIVGSGRRSKSRSWLPILLLALLRDGDGYGGGGCCPCNCGSNNIPIPYPIPIPVNNPIITTGPRKGKVKSKCAGK